MQTPHHGRVRDVVRPNSRLRRGFCNIRVRTEMTFDRARIDLCVTFVDERFSRADFKKNIFFMQMAFLTAPKNRVVIVSTPKKRKTSVGPITKTSCCVLCVF